jgi:hypothetical protein
MQRLELSDNERAILITALRRLVGFDPQSLSPQTQALRAILERLDPQKPQPIPDTASTGWKGLARARGPPSPNERVRQGKKFLPQVPAVAFSMAFTELPVRL